MCEVKIIFKFYYMFNNIFVKNMEKRVLFIQIG